jgi:drug/metabolite transporter (DMT)-like permease
MICYRRIQARQRGHIGTTTMSNVMDSAVSKSSFRGATHISYAYGFIAIVVTLNATAQLLLKAAAEYSLHQPATGLQLQHLLNVYSLSAAVCLGASFLSWRKALSGIPLSRAHPLCSLTYVIMPAGAYYFFDDTVSILYYFGIICICCGIFLISTSEEKRT